MPGTYAQKAGKARRNRGKASLTSHAPKKVNAKKHEKRSVFDKKLRV